MYSKETKDLNVKEFIMVPNKSKAKKWQTIIYVVVNAHSIVQHVIQIKNVIIKHVNVNVKVVIS